MILQNWKEVDSQLELLRKKLSNQYRATVTMKLQSGQQIHVRKSSRPEPPQQEILDALRLPYLPGKIEKTIV